MKTEKEYREEFSKGLFELIMRVSMTDGGRTSMVQAGEIVDEMLSALALLCHGSAEVNTPAKMRKKCDELARTLQKRMRSIQRLAAQGRLDWLTPYNIETEH
jgi:hypothetical protein